jgi:hypothetical protein
MVWITEGGAVYHRSPHCEALLAGQGYGGALFDISPGPAG